MFMEKKFNIGDFHHYNEDGKDTEDGIVMLNIIEFKEDDFHSFTD